MEFFGVFYLVAAGGLAIVGARIDYRERRSFLRLFANLASSAVLLFLFAGWIEPGLRVDAGPLVAILFLVAAAWEVSGTVDEFRTALRPRTVEGPPRYAVVAASIFYLPVVVLAGLAAFGL